MSTRRPSGNWMPATLLVGASYAIMGKLFTLPTANVLAWRRGAWVASAVVFAGHIAFEHFKRRSSARATATHAAIAVAIAAAALALAATLQDLAGGHPVRPVMLLAIVLWPVLLAIPAFVVAFAASAVLARLSSNSAHSLP
ncbi:MAG: hypothetical protein ABI601_09410 [bacterium]